ncbi:hypothetical protein E3P92_03357 [Wallemia ichthyophaga]|uniref:Solute carrier family 25 member 40 n=1 Tax=Wallemia ichthyophaga TaxID=245174 RepID=A0A4T0G6R5_WALIC|nr:hypothetical protein E3P91_03396 [Wallemia ichthyophaga]TIA79320.1 hypothetical protein E3P98_03348 [Wallemia ichthyophaga]TIA89195.1 hypothetical protein E3P97_03184 [Wallemia ichthyophaga]TIA96324.1 hypothetical protein E3P95_03330 [Wallemia ichthyophaga]TIA97327.1 hypothetical protein E3P94_03343 [Wallemia ichthyophaga]
MDNDDQIHRAAVATAATTPATAAAPPLPIIPPSAKLIAASVGAIVTSLSMTPFDVIKVRLQTQSQWHSQRRAHSAHPPQKLPHHAHPISDHITSSNKRLNGSLDAVIKISKFEGPSALWKGLTPTLLMAIPSNAVYMLGYESLHRTLLESGLNTALSPLLAGAIARTFSATVISPLELLRTRLQASSTQSPAQIVQTLRQSVRKSGLRVLWRGLDWTLARDVPFSSFYWAGFELIKRSMIRYEGIEAPIRTPFVAGAASGICAALVTSPFDVLKTRRQALVDASHEVTLPRQLAKKNPSMVSLFFNILRVEGPKALFAGLSPRVAKIAPACGIQIATYSQVSKYWSNRYP